MRQVGPHQPGEQRQHEQQQHAQQHPLPPHRACTGGDNGGGRGENGLRSRRRGTRRHRRACQEHAGESGVGTEAPEGHDRLAVDDIERILARRRQRMAQQAGEVAFGAGPLRCLHRIGETRDVAVQAVDLVQYRSALGFAEVAELARFALERRVPVDALTGRIDLGDRQQVGMLARQPRGDRRAQLAGGAPYRIARHAQRAIALQRFTDEKRTCGHPCSLARANHGVRPARTPHLTCYDDVDRIIPGDRLPIEAEAAAAAARPAGTGQHLAAIDHFDVVGFHIQVVVDGHESGLVTQIVLVAGDAFAA